MGNIILTNNNKDLLIMTTEQEKENYYSELFDNFDLHHVCMGLASAFDAAVAIVARNESLKNQYAAKPNVFTKTLVDSLTKETELAKKFVDLLILNINEEFISWFTLGPKKCNNYGPQVKTLDEVNIRYLGEVFLSRFDWAINNFYGKKELEFWDPCDVTYRCNTTQKKLHPRH